MATMSASDVFLLALHRGVSARRSSFQAVSQLAIPLVTTEPERPDEFDLIPALREKIDNPATALVPFAAGPQDFADAVMAVLRQRDCAVGVSLDSIWREAAARHLAFYDRLLERSAVDRSDVDRRAARWLDAAE